jgi:hypothetical protein
MDDSELEDLSDEVAYGDYRALTERFSRGPVRVEAGTASERHLAETGHRLSFGCCSPAPAGAADDRGDAL